MSTTSSLWAGRSHISTFVHGLHLLDLDQLEDWPEITIQSFGVKASLQHRIRCVEWSLYRLFEQYDARVARDKLRPFFPPTTSLQSVNLRAALLRQLTELKKDGALGQNVILRKTMLDECKGDKIEELLAHFSLVVLKKSLAKRGDPNHVPVVKLGNAVPLILSYRKGIQRNLERRKEFELQAKQQHRTIETSIEALSVEATALEHKRIPDTPDNADLLRKILRENWIGDHAWIDTILHGVASYGIDNVPISQAEDNEDDDPTLLSDLQTRVHAQNSRLAQWQAYLKTLQQNRQAKPPARQADPNNHTKAARFTRHRNLSHQTIKKADDILLDLMIGPVHAELLISLDRAIATQPPATPPAQIESPQRRPMAIPVDVQSDTRTHLSRIKTAPEWARSGSKSSDVSSQSTVVAGSESEALDERNFEPEYSFSDNFRSVERTPTRDIKNQTDPLVSTTPPDIPEKQPSLMERTRQSLAQFDTRVQTNKPRDQRRTQNESGLAITTPSTRGQQARVSLLERTRQSMSMLSNVLDVDIKPRVNTKSKRPTHARSKTVDIPSQRPRLERAWSEESLSSIATKDDTFDVEADHDSVFKSRPRLAMSPNLSPQGSSNDLWLESQLEESMNKLTISSIPK